MKDWEPKGPWDVSLVVSAAVSYMGSRWFGGTEAIARVLELVGSLVVMTALFALTCLTTNTVALCFSLS